jgi:hypothetical protein
MRAMMFLAVVCACGSPSHPGGGDSGGGGDDTDAPGSGGGTLRDRQRQLAIDLHGSPDFMVGVGNDNSGPYDHAVPIDLHYAYLVGYGDQGGWPTWNTDGDYPLYFAQTAEQHSATPMFTYYQLALELENHNDAVLDDATRMHQYLADQRLLFQRIADTGKPAAVQLEPDFFGYLMQRAASGTPPDQLPAKVHFADAPECAALPETASGLVHCVVAIGRATAPKARIAFHASQWGAYFDDTDPNADVEGSAQQIAAFLTGLGDVDFLTVETLDRDAGFWETSGGGATCSISGGSRGTVYWDETNQTYPNFAQYFRWVKALTAAMNRPALEWQTPMGQPSATCGGSDQQWRDNRVHYFFGHIPDLVDAGIAGMTFGTGAGGQTNLATDGDHVKNAAIAYRASPIAM